MASGAGININTNFGNPATQQPPTTETINPQSRVQQQYTPHVQQPQTTQAPSPSFSEQIAPVIKGIGEFASKNKVLLISAAIVLVIGITVYELFLKANQGTNNVNGSNSNSENTNSSTSIANPKADTDNIQIDKLSGMWEIKVDGFKTYLKVTRDKTGKFIFEKGSEYEGKPIFNPFMLDKGNAIYLIPTNGKLIGKFASYNFYATHGQLYNYQVTLEYKSDNRMLYSEYCSIRGGENEQYEATKITMFKTPYKEIAKNFLGSWGCMGQDGVTISCENNTFKLAWDAFGGHTDIYDVVSCINNVLKLKSIKKGEEDLTIKLVNLKEIEIQFGKANVDGSYSAQNCIKF